VHEKNAARQADNLNIVEYLPVQKADLVVLGFGNANGRLVDLYNEKLIDSGHKMKYQIQNSSISPRHRLRYLHIAQFGNAIPYLSVAKTLSILYRRKYLSKSLLLFVRSLRIIV